MKLYSPPFCWKILFAFLLLLPVAPIQAQALLLTELPDGSLGTRTNVLVEDGPPLSLEQAQARQREGLFSPGKRPVLTYGIGARPLWVHLELNNPTAQSIPLDLVLGTTWTDRLDLFIVHDGQVAAYWQTGDEFPDAPGLTQGRGYTFPASFIPGHSDLYMRIKSIDPFVFPIELLTKEQFISTERQLHYSYGLIYGFLFALLVYNLMLFVGMNERSYLYYSLYLACLIMLNLAYTGHGYAWLWPSQPQFQRYIILVLMVLYSCSGLLFAGRFLALAKHAPHVLRLLRLSSLAGLGLITLCIVTGSQFGAALVAFTFMTLFSLGMVLLGIFTIREGLTAGRYFLVATIFGMLGAASTTLSVWGWLPFNLFTYHGLEAGIVIEATLLALALTYRFNEMHKNLSLVTIARDALAREVAERKRAEQALLLANHAAEAASLAKNEFLSSISHELRTPLHTILGFSQLLGQGDSMPDDTRNHANKIERAGNHLLSLVNDLMDLSRIETGQMEVSMGPVSLLSVIRDSHEMTVAMARQLNIDVQLEIDSSDNIIVDADFVRIRQVIINLLSNAIKYNRPKGTVHLSCRRNADMVRISIADTGRGIATYKQSRIFTAFDRLGAENGVIEGTGIGLVISKRIIETMGGSIGFESIEGLGSTFWVEVPTSKTFPPQNSEASAPVAPQETIAQLTDNLSVLYIEDNPTSLYLMQIIFKDKRLKLRCAESAEIGIESARTEPPDLILMDINLPGMSGFEALKILKADIRTAHIPVAAVTAKSMQGDFENGLSQGFAAYFTKPLDISTFYNSLSKLIVQP